MRRYTVTVDGTPFSLDVEETAADRFTVTVDGRTFETSLEGDEDLPGAIVAPGIPVPASPAVAVPVRAPAPGAGSQVTSGAPHAAAARPAPAAGSGGPAATHATGRDGSSPRGVTARVGDPAGGSVVAAPMPGVILEVHVVAGAGVQRGDPLVVLEAMKMRNTIRSPRDGIVVEVTAEAGRPVVPGEPLVRLADAPR